MQKLVNWTKGFLRVKNYGSNTLPGTLESLIKWNSYCPWDENDMVVFKCFGFSWLFHFLFQSIFLCSLHLPFSENWILDLNDVFCPMDIWNFHLKSRILQISFFRLLLKFMHMIFPTSHSDPIFFEFNLRSAIWMSPNCKLTAYKSKYLYTSGDLPLLSYGWKLPLARNKNETKQLF